MFQKGQSGNPGGKPRTQKKFQELLALEIQARTGGTAAKHYCKRLIDFMEHGETEKIQFNALKLAMAYSLGAPQQMLEINAIIDIADRLKRARERAGLPPLPVEEIPLVVPDVNDEGTDPN